MNDKFCLSDVSYFVSDIQDCFEYISKKHKTLTDNPPIRIYIDKIENKITFKIKVGYYLEPLTPETMKLTGSSENKITKDKISENVPHLEFTEVVLVHCNIFNKNINKIQESRIYLL